MRLIGPWLNPRELQVSGDISDFFADVEHIQVRNNGPIRFAISGQMLDIQQLRLAGQGTDLTVVGKVELSGEHQLDLRATGNADLQLIQSFDPLVHFQRHCSCEPGAGGYDCPACDSGAVAGEQWLDLIR